MLKKEDLAKRLQETRLEKGQKINRDDASELIDDVLDSIVALTKESGKLQLYRFGNFEVKERAARKGRNPQTGEELMIDAKKAFTFSPAKAVKEAVK